MRFISLFLALVMLAGCRMDCLCVARQNSGGLDIPSSAMVLECTPQPIGTGAEAGSRVVIKLTDAEYSKLRVQAEGMGYKLPRLLTEAARFGSAKQYLGITGIARFEQMPNGSMRFTVLDDTTKRAIALGISG